MGTTRRRRGRGQTGVDFVVGVGIFLLTIGFVVSFVPGMFTPFGDDTASPLVADRIADELTGDVLATDPGTTTLDPDRTQAFFERGTVPAWLAVPNGTAVNVTVQRNTTGGPARETVTRSGTRLAMGEAVPERGASVSDATRPIALEDEAAVVVVRAW